VSRSDPTVEVTGGVPDVRPYLWNAAVAAAPLRQARGIQNKVLEAVAAGLPTVVTPVVAEGLPEQILPACRTAEGAEQFADAVSACLRLEPAVRREVALRANFETLTWESRLAPLIGLLSAASIAAASNRRKITGEPLSA
jgi:glycosyltransferase involved in cell wall biosynthesis